MSKLTMQPIRRIPIINARTIGFTIAFAIVGTMLLLTGCGGGGGGGGPSFPTPTLPAGAVVFESSNAISMANQAMDNSGFVGITAKQQQVTSTVKSIVGLVAGQLTISNHSATIATGATETTVLQCGGPNDGNITITANGNNSSATGTLSFNTCIEGTLTINGSISFGGSINNAGDFSFEGGGSITISDSSDFITMVMYFAETSNLNNPPYPFTSSFSFSLDGTGLPDGGFLVETTQPFIGDINGATDGQITIYGGDGINGNPTRILIDITGIGTADVYLDIDDGFGFIIQGSSIII